MHATAQTTTTTTMSPNELCVTIPSLFRCPISLDVMTSPVSLCTGVTYDRASIQHWLDSGHNTCPATNQQLPSKAIVPNLTLHRLISIWLSSQPSPPSSKPPVLRQHVGVLLHALRSNLIGGSSVVEALSKISGVVEFSDDNRRFCVNGVDGFVEGVVGVLCKGCDVELLEFGFKVLHLVLVETGVKERVQSTVFDGNLDGFLSAVHVVLHKGNLMSKIGCVRVLEELIGCNDDSKRAIAKDESLFSALIELLGSENDSSLQDAVLSFLISVSCTRLARIRLVQLGVVLDVTRMMMSSSGNKDKSRLVAEKCIQLLMMVSTCSEGRSAICKDLKCVEAIMQWLVKVSSSAREDAVAVLWSSCCLCRDEKVQEVVARANGMTKVLLVMQSNCDQSVKRMCKDLIKVLTCKTCLVGCETLTIQIRPC